MLHCVKLLIYILHTFLSFNNWVSFVNETNFVFYNIPPPNVSVGKSCTLIIFAERFFSSKCTWGAFNTSINVATSVLVKKLKRVLFRLNFYDFDLMFLKQNNGLLCYSTMSSKFKFSCGSSTPHLDRQWSFKTIC